MEAELNFKSGGCINLGLRIGICIYALLYLLFAYDEFLPLNSPNSWDLEHTVIKMLFIAFIVGFTLSWKFELISGLIFLFWFVIMCYQAFFICSGDCDDGIVMGIPLFILSIFFIVFGLRKRRSKALRNLS